MNTWSRTSASWIGALANGPAPRTVCQIVTPETASTTSAVTGRPARTAAAMATGNTMYSRGCGVGPISWPKTKCVTAAAPATNSAVCTQSRRDQTWRTVVRMAGATISAPIASPSHQSNHSAPNRSHGCTPARQRVETPTVALTMVQRTAPISRSARTSGTRRRPSSNRGSRRSAHTATTLSRVLPVARMSAVHSGASVPALTANAPTHTAGQKRRPPRSSAASAMPVGGQTVVTCSATKATRKPSCAARK
jgi:hypothetical protein